MLLAKTKPEQSLAGHSELTREKMLRIIRRSLSVWQARLKQLGLPVDGLEEIMEFMAAAHDLGKGTGPWQRYLRGQGPQITHTLFSMLMAKEAYKGKQDLFALAMLLAILSHHGQLHNGSFQDARTTALGRIGAELQHINAVLADLDLPPISKAEFTGAEGQRIVNKLQRMVAGLDSEQRLRFKALYCLFHTQLRLADNEASANLTGGGGMIRFHWGAVKGFNQTEVATSPNEIQRQVAATTGNLILRAGCGVGKTGAALTFAMDKIRADEADRIIFTLPTQFTTNSMYWDLPGKYGIPDKLRGIYHSEVESVLRLEPDGERDTWKRQQKYQNTFYNLPVTVSTVDHLLYSLLHSYKYADRSFGNIFTAAVIFDEVHYYDHFTLNKIGQCLELMRDLHIPHMVMTATMPQVVLDRLQQQAGGSYQVINQHEQIPARPYTVIKEDQPIMSAEGNLSTQLLSLVKHYLGSKQMLVVNRVGLAQKLAQKLAEEFPKVNIVCYHSQFRRCDRSDKERLVKALFEPVSERTAEQRELIAKWGLSDSEGVLLVSTQVCELSLDISADVMYSQAAPVDSIVQRGGRLHRKGKLPDNNSCDCPGCQARNYLPANHDYHLHLFPLDWQDEKDFLPYGLPIQREWLLRSWQVVQGDYTYATAQTWVDQVFTDSPDLCDSVMREMILEDIVFGRTPKERYGDEGEESSAGSFQVRDIPNSTVTVIPACYEREVLAKDNRDVIADYGVRVAVWLFQDYGYDKNKLWFLDLPYSPEFGFERGREK